MIESINRCNNPSNEWIELKQISEQFASPTTPSVDCKSLVYVGNSHNFIACDSVSCKLTDYWMHSEWEGLTTFDVENMSIFNEDFFFTNVKTKHLKISKRRIGKK